MVVVILPVASWVDVVSIIINWSADSSQPKNTFFSVFPLLIKIPLSFGFVLSPSASPLFNIIILSSISRFVVLIYVVVPETVKSPVTVKPLLIVWFVTDAGVVIFI